jgi:glycosyltransferase involved in cell wall biosynthesis
MMRRVLIVTFFFPPNPAVASQRLKGLAKYLPEFGWEPVVLTPPLPGPPETSARVVQTAYTHTVGSMKKSVGLKSDRSVEQQFGGFYQSAVKFCVRLLGEVVVYPDYEAGWHPHAVRAGLDLLSKERFDAILSSSGPGTAHVIARELRDHSKRPWLADLRDLWTQHYYYPWSPIRQAIERRLELKTLSAAGALTTVSPPLAEKLAQLHRQSDIRVIPNGFEPDEQPATPTALTSEFTITYTGTLYPRKQDPSLLFQAISNRPVRVRFFGRVLDPAWVEGLIHKYGVKSQVELLGVRSRDEILRLQRESHLLLLLDWMDIEQKGVYTGKIFEYLAAGRPILSIGHEGGVVKELLDETGAGTHHADAASIQKRLDDALREFERTGSVPSQADPEKIRRYSHREMTRKFADALNEISRGSP